MSTNEESKNFPKGEDYVTDDQIDPNNETDFQSKDDEKDCENKPSKSVGFSVMDEVHEVSRYKPGGKDKYRKISNAKKASYIRI